MDRVDVWRRTRDASSKAIGDTEALVEEDVRAMVGTQAVDAVAGLLGPGTVQPGNVTVIMESHHDMRTGYVIQVSGTTIRYNVTAVSRYPNHHSPLFIVASCSLDLVRGTQ